jgi:hypothetical protein
MTATRKEIEAEVRANFEAFTGLLPSLVKVNQGKFALLRSRAVVEIFDSAGDARKYAEAQFKDGLYSIQQIVEGIADLGYFSHAVSGAAVSGGHRSDPAASGGGPRNA